MSQTTTGTSVLPAPSPDWQRSGVLIGGTYEPVADGRSAVVENPATGQPIGTTGVAGLAESDRAVRAAVDAFGNWSATSITYRTEVVARLADELEQRREAFVQTTVAELGAPIRLVREDHVALALDVVRAYLDAAVRFEPEYRTALGGRVLREAAGVVACITPWNFPLYQIVAKVVPALIAGCTVVLKPPEQTPLNAYLFADAVLATELLDGVVNVLPGGGPEVGAALVTHPDVDVVSFTGSTAVGRLIGERAAASVKRVCLELGGKSASLVAPDADLERAVRATVDSAYYNGGQTCSALTRLLVPEDRREEAVAIARDHAAAQRVGDPTDPATDIGSLVSSIQRDRVEAMVAEAERSATVWRTEAPLPEAGYFVRPTVVSDVSPEDTIAQQEVFGPVLTVLGYGSDAEAIRIANGTPYGLAGAVWSGDVGRARQLGRRMRAGQISINGAAAPHDAPFGGFGQSGNGRELGDAAIDEFVELKVLQEPEPEVQS
jgi:acyl-CoA reductase-like NAD-dependent aldehyde dehydrogenase